jgi:hypothetical protein
MKSNGSIRVVRMWCGIRTDPILSCFVNLEGLVGVVPKLASWLMV